MLKKKFEEAKEVLLRAVVNNNNLLMLNHPIHEEKISFYCLYYYFSLSIGFCFFNYEVERSLTVKNIHKVQKFAAELMSKELKT